MLEERTALPLFVVWHVGLGKRAGVGWFLGMAAAPELILAP